MTRSTRWLYPILFFAVACDGLSGPDPLHSRFHLAPPSVEAVDTTADVSADAWGQNVGYSCTVEGTEVASGSLGETLDTATIGPVPLSILPEGYTVTVACEASAHDGADGESYSPSRTVQVPADAAPVVTLTSDSSEAVIGNVVPLTVEAQDTGIGFQEIVYCDVTNGVDTTRVEGDGSNTLSGAVTLSQTEAGEFSAICEDAAGVVGTGQEAVEPYTPVELVIGIYDWMAANTGERPLMAANLLVTRSDGDTIADGPIDGQASYLLRPDTIAVTVTAEGMHDQVTYFWQGGDRQAKTTGAASVPITSGDTIDALMINQDSILAGHMGVQASRFEPMYNNGEIDIVINMTEFSSQDSANVGVIKEFVDDYLSRREHRQMTSTVRYVEENPPLDTRNNMLYVYRDPDQVFGVSVGYRARADGTMQYAVISTKNPNVIGSKGFLQDLAQMIIGSRDDTSIAVEVQTPGEYTLTPYGQNAFNFSAANPFGQDNGSQ